MASLSCSRTRFLLRVTFIPRARILAECLFTLSKLNLGRASIYALKKVNCIFVLKLGLGFCNGRYAVSNSRLTGLSGHFCWNEVKIIVYCDEMVGARVFKPSWMTGKNKSLPLPLRAQVFSCAFPLVRKYCFFACPFSHARIRYLFFTDTL